jgi:hypothetical protein
MNMQFVRNLFLIVAFQLAAEAGCHDIASYRAPLSALGVRISDVLIFAVLFTHSPKSLDRNRGLGRQLSRAIGALLLSAAAAHAEIQHVIAISVDGLRGDLLQSFVSASPQDFPNFIRLRKIHLDENTRKRLGKQLEAQ